MSHEAGSQHITATVAVAGEQEVNITTHTANGPGSYIAVAYAGMIIWLYDQRAVSTYQSPWNEAASRILAASLPIARPLEDSRPGGYSPTLAIRATGADQTGIYRRADALIVRVGHITWVVYDRDAYDHQVAMWQRVNNLAQLTLPRRYDRNPTSSQLRGAARPGGTPQGLVHTRPAIHKTRDRR